MLFDEVNVRLLYSQSANVPDRKYLIAFVVSRDHCPEHVVHFETGVGGVNDSPA